MPEKPPYWQDHRRHTPLKRSVLTVSMREGRRVRTVLRAMRVRSTSARHRIRHGIRHTAVRAGRRPCPSVANGRLRYMRIGYSSRSGRLGVPQLPHSLVRRPIGNVKLRLTAVSDPQHGGFTAGSSPVSCGSIDELFVNLTVPPRARQREPYETASPCLRRRRRGRLPRGHSPLSPHFCTILYRGWPHRSNAGIECRAGCPATVVRNDYAAACCSRTSRV